MKFRLVDPIEVEFSDGAKRALRLSMYGLRKAQNKLQELRGERRSIYTIINEEARQASEFNVNADFVSVMMWAAMLENEPDLSFEDAEKMILNPVEGFTQVLQLIQKAFFGDRPREKSAEEDEPPDPLAPSQSLSNGKGSGASPESRSD